MTSQTVIAIVRNVLTIGASTYTVTGKNIVCSNPDCTICPLSIHNNQKGMLCAEFQDHIFKVISLKETIAILKTTNPEFFI